ncbi:MAG TPA: serine hydrolase domain-containing protein [Longimicrobiales bacterium]|nr:serine hydrolase domain-containing protein [Longimicrobiales bacterium]
MSTHACKRIALLLLLALAGGALFGAAPAAAQLGAPVTTALGDRLERAVEALRTHQDTSGVAGISAALAVDGRLVWTGGFGTANLETLVPMRAETVSRIGSISKPVAGAAAMVLVDRGRLDLDAPVSRYVPGYPRPQGDRITTRRLMSHTAGVRHYRGEEFASAVRYDDVVAPMAVFWADSLLFEPGTDYAYSTYGWTVVSAVTAAAAARPWVEVLRDEVVRPLGLLSLQPEWQDSLIPHRASYYERTAEGWVNAPAVDNSNKWAGGGLVATAADLVGFALGLLEGRVLSEAARAESWRRQTPEGESSYGLGWSVGELDGHRVVSHSGGSMGATAMLVVLPDDGIVVSVLGNTSNIGHAGIAARVARILLGL